MPKRNLVPAEGFEPPTYGLQNRCTTAVLSRLKVPSVPPATDTAEVPGASGTLEWLMSEPATDAEFAALRARLAATAPLTADELAAFPRPQRRRLAKSGVFLAAGEPAQEVAVVHSGGLREYYLLADGSERTRSFNLPGDFAGSLADLLDGGPSRTWVVAEVPTLLLVTPWDAYRALSESSPGWQRFARRVAERLYRQKTQREYELLALDAAARYRCALARWPTLEQVFRQRHLASYLGVTPVHLSRLRAARRVGAP